ncbi:hypothetical protein Bpfe_012719 [Biomphalaria pfeifferi]|uniref:Uncharacterized protein n=1 Tax=Biomphalaria pfeifferi TaxID=112525 RepID=A0AAD8BNE7_BIOPF|nr:hypothetical protein Bpfe_012719 [Biomphalaria pfeifferi]
MAQTQVVLQDINELIDLFLSPDFEPLQKSESTTKVDTFHFEAEGEEFDEDFQPDPDHYAPFIAMGHESRFLKGVGVTKTDKETCGRTLAKMGDEFYSSKMKERMTVKEHLRGIFQPLESRSTDPEVERNAWEKFKNVMDSYIATGSGDAPKVLGAILLTVSGLSYLGSGVKDQVKNFTRRYITQRNLDRDIARMGGLNAIMSTQLD